MALFHSHQWLVAHKCLVVMFTIHQRRHLPCGGRQCHSKNCHKSRACRRQEGQWVAVYGCCCWAVLHICSLWGGGWPGGLFWWSHVVPARQIVTLFVKWSASEVNGRTTTTILEWARERLFVCGCLCIRNEERRINMGNYGQVVAYSWWWKWIHNLQIVCTFHGNTIRNKVGELIWFLSSFTLCNWWCSLGVGGREMRYGALLDQTQTHKVNGCGGTW